MKSIKFLASILLITLSDISYSQNEPKKIEIINGTLEPLVQTIDGLTADMGFQKTDEWINYNFKNADAVIGSSVDSKMLRFTGITPNFATSMGYSYDLEYTIRVEFKDNKYRFTVEQLRSGNNGIFTNFNLADYYKSNGEPKKLYSSFVNGIHTTLDNLNLSLFNHLTGNSENNDDW